MEGLLVKYAVFCTDEATKELQSVSERRVYEFQRRVELLQNGQWQNGTRVKKLRSLNKKRTIYEARVDKARRMLFSVLRSREPEIKASLLIFHFEVEHDKVIHRASQILQDRYSRKEYELEIDKECSVDDVVEESKNQWQNEEDMYNRHLDQLKSFELDDDTFLRMLKRKEMNEQQFWDLKLSLSTEQRAILKDPLPILLSGTAGSGKTTIIIHKLLESPAKQKKLYVTYTKELCDEAEKQFNQLVKGLDDEQLYVMHTHFKTFNELLEETKLENFNNMMTKEKFLHEYEKYTRGTKKNKDFPPLMIWEEIRGIWKSGLFAAEGYIIAKDDYVALSKDQAPNFYSRRLEALQIFEWYERRLEELNVNDEQDLLFQAINNNYQTYDFVCCDEVQDLTVLHIQLLYELTARDATRLLLTGDDQQILHHSGFRWENLSEVFHRKFYVTPPRKLDLSYNYRSVGAIIDLANSINEIQKKYTDQQTKTRPPVSLHHGGKPQLISGIKAREIGQIIKDFGPHQAIIVRNERVRETLRNSFYKHFKQSPLVFTIDQVKGLEFESVILWEFFREGSQEAEFWEKVKRYIDLGYEYRILESHTNKRQLAYETNTLYVGVTRGARQCTIFEGPKESSFWQLESIAPYIDKTNQLNNLNKDKEVLEINWFEEGKFLFEKKLFLQALDCFVRVKDHEETYRYINLCHGHLAFSHQQFEQALLDFKRVRAEEEMLKCYGAMEKYKEALTFIKEIKKKYNVIYDKEKEKHWEDLFLEYKIKCYDSLGLLIGSGIYCNRKGAYIEAAHRFEKAGDWYFAIDAYRRAEEKFERENQTDKLSYVKTKIMRINEKSNNDLN